MLLPSGTRQSASFQKTAAKVAAAGIAALLVVLAGRLVEINTAEAARLNALGTGQYHSRSIIPARRGTIFDAQGRILAGSRDLPSVFADPSQVQDVAETAARVAAILQADAGQIEEQLRHRSAPQFCWISHCIAPVEAEAIRNAKLPGIGVVEEPARHYPMGQALGQVIGFTSSDGKGLEGLELAYDQWLSGQGGWYWTVRDTRRRPIRASDEPEHAREEARDGGHIVLTVDSVIQEFLEERLARQIQDFRAESGVAVVMEPQTGDVLAMACYPPFDPNAYSESPAELRRNRAVTDMVEPGSVFKPFIASAALVEQAVTLNEKIYCHDGLHVIGGRRLHDTHPRGELTLKGIVVESSNIGMGILGSRLGNEALHRWLRAFGFGQPTGIGFPGESPGGVAPLEDWTNYSTLSVTFGQEIALTPLQLVTAFCAIVNDGVLLKPRLVRARLASDGAVVEEFWGPDPVRRVLPVEVARYFTQDVLVSVVNGTGSAHNAAIPGYQVLGKTGTAQVAYANRRGYEPGAYLSSFMGAAPARDPRVAVLVMIQRPNPAKGYYGGVVSAPVVGDVLASTLAYLQVPPDEGAVAARQDPLGSAGARLRAN